MFDSHGSFILNKKTGHELPNHERDCCFELDLWVQESQEDQYPDLEHQPNVTVRQRYKELVEDEEDQESIDMVSSGR